jgi:hypothetical protein
MMNGGWTRGAVLAWLAMTALLAGCEQPEDTTGGTGGSFALTACDADSACGEGFECAVFPCATDCDPDAGLDCDACQSGTICLPRPADECVPEDCPEGTVCERSCTGACDRATNWCADVACQVACVPVGVPTPPDDGQSCVTDFTDACLPPGYPVAARLDDVCAQQGMVLTDVSVAAECWPGAVQFQWTCCRGDVPTPEPTCYDECRADGVCTQTCCDPATGACWTTDPGQPTPCQKSCDDAGTCWESCCDEVGTCCERQWDASGAYVERCCDAYGQCWGTEPVPPACYEQCDENGACATWCCDATTGECWPTTEPGKPECWTDCDSAGYCRETCCDPTTGECWTNEIPGEPTQVCVEGGYGECLPPDVDPKARAWEECTAQGLELTSFEVAFDCGDGLVAYKWTCCGPAVSQPPQCWTECKEDGYCVETCCDAYSCWSTDPNPPSQCWEECSADGTCYKTCCDAAGNCWTDDPGVPTEPQCWKECSDDGTCRETCCDAAGNCWTNDPGVPSEPQCWKECRDDGTCYETCCDAAGQCWVTTDPVPPTDPNACVTRETGAEGSCTDLETLLAFASWDCAAAGLALTESSPWGDCNGAYQGLKYTCCVAP